MSVALVAAEYAAGLLRLGKNPEKLNRWRDDLAELRKVWADAPGWRAYYESPVVRSEEKKKILRRLFSGQVADEVLHLLCLLVDKRRTMIVPALCRAYPRLLHRHRKEVEVRVHTAAPLAKDEERAVINSLAAILNRPVYLNSRVRPALIGGISLEVEGRRWDNSFLAKLERLGLELRNRCAVSGISTTDN